MPNSLVQVAFHDAQVVCVMHDGKPFVALRPLCDALEIAWPRQYAAIKRDPVLSSTVTEMITVGADGKTRSMLCLPLDYLNGWLFRLDAGRYKPGDPRRDRIVAYQRECYQVLHDYFAGGKERMDDQGRMKAARDALAFRAHLAKNGYRTIAEIRSLMALMLCDGAPATVEFYPALDKPESNPYCKLPMPKELPRLALQARERNARADRNFLDVLPEKKRPQLVEYPRLD